MSGAGLLDFLKRNQQMEWGITLLRNGPLLCRLEDCRRVGPVGQLRLEVGVQREVGTSFAPGLRIVQWLTS
jgi:hypothetical protein